MIIKRIKSQLKIFDLIVIFLFIFLGLSLFFVLFRKQSHIKVVVKVNEESLAYQIGGVPNWYAQFFKKGMKEIDAFGKTIAEVKEIKTYLNQNFSNQKTSNQQTIVHLVVDLTTVYSLANRQHTYKGRKVLIGSNIELILDNILVQGIIIDIGEIKKTNIKKFFAKGQIINSDPVFPQTEGVSQFVAESIKEGEIMKDSLGNPAIKILKKTVDDAKMIVTTSNGDALIQKNPLKKDVFLDLEIWGGKIGDRYYLFGDTNFPILIGYSLPFSTKKTAVFITITEINGID